MHLLFLLIFSSQLVFIAQQVDCDRNRERLITPTTTTTTEASLPGIIKQTFEEREHSWVPGLSAAVIVIVVFMISIFACCIHCPFCLVYRRSDIERVV